LAEPLPLPTPALVRVGKPSSRFEHTWTIARWVEVSRPTGPWATVGSRTVIRTGERGLQ
jgi:hypothetical protein